MNSKPLSGVLLKGDSFAVVVYGEKFVYIEALHLEQYQFGIPFWKWKISRTYVNRVLNILDTSHFCLLLPKLKCNGNNMVGFENSFWFITSKWLEMDDFGNIGKYKFVKASYDENDEANANSN